jgi:hypothetical protein
MITQPAPQGAGQIFANAFGGANLATTALTAVKAFAGVHQINQEAHRYLDTVFQNYFFHVAQVQSMYRAHQINTVQASSSINIWKDARDGAILAVQGIDAATAEAATNAAITAFVAIIGAAMDAALKAFL